MPNWVFNSLQVSGDKVSLDKLREQLNQPVTKHFPDTNYDKELEKWVDTPATQHYSNPVFSFWNVIAPTDLEAYYGESYKSDNEDLIEKIKEEFAVGMDWYNWNVRNWGTKWDICVSDGEKYSNTTLEIDEYGSLLYHFETAWSPVIEVIDALAQMYPELVFDYEYEEEQGWGGSHTWVNGEVTDTMEYDIPSSHADFEALDHRECNCQVDDDPTYWFKDCPVDTDKYELLNGEWVEKEGVEA